MMIERYKRVPILLTALAALAVYNSGCSSAQPANNAQIDPPSKEAPNATKPSAYPPLSSELANGEFELLDGSLSKIADRKGKVVLLNLWATWCGPCRGEIPHLVEMQDKYRDKGFTVVGLDIGFSEGGQEEVADIKRFAEKFKINYELARDINDLDIKFNNLAKFNGVPQSYLIDREGRLRAIFLGGGDSQIDKMKSSVEKIVNE